MRTAAYYREEAARFRQLANDVDEQTAAALILLAEEYEAEAGFVETEAEPPAPTIDE